MAERSRIARYFAPLAADEAGSFSLTDDTAVLTPPAGQQLVITTDSVIEGIHVLTGATPQQFAQKLIRRNLSDLAAMGATPWRYTLNLHTPACLTDDWFAAFSAALAVEQQQFGMVLVGGDSTTGGNVIHCSVTCFGLLDGAALRRNGAAIGDDLYVSGTLGGAAYALQLLKQDKPVSDALETRYHRPEPRLALGNALRSIASGAIDISDGLLADVSQICIASDSAATIERALIPHDDNAQDCALSGGDDYELCFTADFSHRDAIQQLAQELKLPLTRIGSIVEGSGVKLVDEKGDVIPINRTGWEHP